LEDRIRWAAFEELQHGRRAQLAALAAAVGVTHDEVRSELRRPVSLDALSSTMRRR
jgi:hypothetical protein